MFPTTARLHLALEDKMKYKLNMKSDFATWLIRWVGEVLTKYVRGKDGKTPWERRRGEKCSKPICIIGEKVLYLPLRTASIHTKKAEPKMFEGIWLGVDGRTGVFIGTKTGVVKCRTVKDCRVARDGP